MASPTCRRPGRHSCDWQKFTPSRVRFDFLNFGYRVMTSRLSDHKPSANECACGLFLGNPSSDVATLTRRQSPSFFLCARVSLVMALHLREWHVAAQALVGVKNSCNFRIAPARPHYGESQFGKCKNSLRSRFHHGDEIIE